MTSAAPTGTGPADPSDQPGPPGALGEVREVTEARVLAALAHPLRNRLLEILKLDGPATASVLAERTEQAVGNVSHHLKQLAACELIVEAPELAKDRRERWWRAVPGPIVWSRAAFEADPAAALVEQAASSLLLEKHFTRAREWAARDPESAPGWHTDGPFAMDTWLRLTPAELVQVGEEIHAVIRKWHDRVLPDDGAARDTVYLFTHAFPSRP